METGGKRVSGRKDASITDASEFPLIAEQKPHRKWLGVEIDTRNVDPKFHSFNRPPTSSDKRSEIKAVEILDQVLDDDKDFVFVFYENGNIKKVEKQLLDLILPSTNSFSSSFQRDLSSPLIVP